MHVTGRSIGRHVLNAVAAWAGLLFETIVINMLAIKLTSKPLERTTVTSAVTVTAHVANIVTLPLDWLSGWYIPWIRLFLLLRDLFIVYQALFAQPKETEDNSST
eukprot:m.229667 g.229667  ORF g.229667 m.229667 type:complete len:105 (-) comp17344_c0_seq4:84-398(-)